MDKFLEFLNNTSVIITIATLLIIAFSKTIIKIFNMGVTFKSNLASKKDLKEFESEIRKDLRGYVVQIQKAATDACMRVIEAKLQNVENLQESAKNIELMKTELEMEIKHTLEKFDDVKSMSDSLRSLTNKVSRLEHANDLKEIGRRTEK